MVSVYKSEKSPKGLSVTFPYHPNSVTAIKQVLGLEWNPKGKSWDSVGPEILLDLERRGIGINYIEPKAKEIATEFRQQLWDAIDTRIIPTDDTPYGYQKQGKEFLKIMPNVILADEPGVGKTKQSLDAALEITQDNILVICPKTLCYNWKAEVLKWHPEITADVVPDVLHSKKTMDRETFWKYPPQIVIANYEKLLAADWPHYRNWEIFIMDEVSAKVKNSQTLAYKAVKKVIRRSGRSWALTGTPLEIRLQELYNILALLRPSVLGNYMRFKTQHMETDWAGNIVATKNLELLRERIGPFMLRRTKEEVLKQLPPKTYNNAYVKLTVKEMAAYEAFTSQFKNWLSEHGVSGAGDPLVQMLRMRQFCCTPKIFTDDLGWGSKFEAIKELVTEWPGQIIIFDFFEEVVSLLQQYLGTHPEAMISGKVSSSQERLRRIDAFNAGKIGKILLSTDAGGMGLNITAADLIIHVSPLWNPQRMKQREDRAHRIGQTRPVTVTNMLCIDTLDHGMYKLGLERQELFNQVIDGAGEQFIRKLSASKLLKMVEGRI